MPGEELSEADRVDRARAGDRSAFRDLYRSHHPRVFAFTLRLTASREDAEEVTQDTFVAAWRQLSDYRGEGKFTSWLHGIALRLCRQRWRHRVRRQRGRERHAREGYAPTVVAAMTGARLDLEVAIAALPPRMRTAVVLHMVEGYTLAETASLMGVAEGTIKTHVHRGRAAIHQRLGSEHTAAGPTRRPKGDP